MNYCTFSNGNWERFGRNNDLDDHFNPNADRSYKFGFTAEDHSREEESNKGIFLHLFPKFNPQCDPGVFSLD